MYIHIGKDFIINSNSIVTILNIDYVKNTKEYKSMYKQMEENKEIIYITNKKEKTFILTEEDKKKKAYISNIGVNTILKRVLD